MRQLASSLFRKQASSQALRYFCAAAIAPSRATLLQYSKALRLETNRNDGSAAQRTPTAVPQSWGEVSDVGTGVKENLPEHDDISITGAKGQKVDVQPLDSFTKLSGLPDWLSGGVQHLGFTTPTVIQKFTIPALQKGHDIIGLAPTGSGKTVAFAIPALQQMRPNSNGSPSVLVLAPTRELVQQTTKVFERLSQGRVRICEAYGGTPREVQARKLHRGCDVLVACPGRLKDFLDNGDVSLSGLSFLVFDEADRLLDMGFQVQLADILAYIEPSQRVQRMMWSATWPASVQDLARAYLSSERLLIRAGTAGTGAQVNEHIKQRVIFTDGFQDRVEKLVGLIESGEIDENTAKIIIFVERQTDTEDVAQALSRRLGIDGRYVGTLHGGLSQRRRDSVMGDFKHSHIRLLVATDVASRGLDIPDVTCVVNFQTPQNIDSYCHRIGRTGRAGRSGDSFTFMGKEDGGIAAELVDYLKRCGMEVPAQLTELEARNETESRSRRRNGRGSFDRGNRNRPPGRFGGGQRRNNYGGRRDQYGSQQNYYGDRKRDSYNQRENDFSWSQTNRSSQDNGWM